MADDDLDFGATIRGYSPGQIVFKRYRLEKILGRGGMGVVWLAHDQDLERDVALKFLPEVVAGDKQAIKDLKRETRRSLELTHPHIVRIYDFIQDQQTAAISMEFVAGDTLASLKVDQPDGHFEVADLEKWTEQLCAALTYAHDKAKVVHRDLKPANLMIDAAGDLKIADFGIAANISDSVSRVSQQAGSSGTPVYMSPQQMMGEKPAVTDDVYALGATLYDLLTSRPPFHSGNVMMQVMNKVPMSMVERRTDLAVKGIEIPPVWDRTVLACLAKEADDRPQTVAEVWQRLTGAGGAVESPKPKVESPIPEPLPPPAPEPAPPEPAPVPVSQPEPKPAAAPATPATPTFAASPKSKAPLFIGLAAAIVLIGGGTAWWLGIEQPRREAVAARQAEEARLAAIRIPVSIRSNVEGATVLIDGNEVGTTPYDRSSGFALGDYEIELRKDGYEPRETILRVTEDTGDLFRIDLERSFGTVMWELGDGVSDIRVWLRQSEDRPAQIHPTFSAEGIRVFDTTNGPDDWQPLAASVETVVDGGTLFVPTGRYFGYLLNEQVAGPGGGMLRPVEFEVVRGGLATVSADMAGERLEVSTNVDDEVTYELWGRGGQYRDEQEAWVGEGTLPLDTWIAPGEYSLILQREGRGIERQQNLLVGSAGTRVEVDMRGATLVIAPQTEGTEVVDASGQVVGSGDRVILRDQPPGEGLTYTVRREGYESVSKSFFFQDDYDSKTETRWDPKLEELSAARISTDWRRGPSRVRAEFTVDSNMRSRMNMLGNDTSDGEPIRQQTSVSRVYNIERFNSVGSIRTVTSPREVVSQGVETYLPNTVVRFELQRGRWLASLDSGGYVTDGVMVETTESPFYPAMWVNRATLPDDMRNPGDTWEVPIALAGTLIPSFKSTQPTGRITGRIGRVDLNSANPTAEIIYTHDISGPMETFVTGIAAEMEGRITGTLTLIMDLRRRFISSGTWNATTEINMGSEMFSSDTTVEAMMSLEVTPLEWPEGGQGDSALVTSPAQTTPAEPLVRVAPVYPTRAQMLGLEGRVVIALTVGKDGAVYNAQIEESTNAIFNEAALEAVRKYKFKPAIQNGEPIAASLRVPIRFKLED